MTQNDVYMETTGMNDISEIASDAVTAFNVLCAEKQDKINQLEELLIIHHQAFQSIKELVKDHAFENEPVRLNQQPRLIGIKYPSWASEVMHIVEKFA